jgi:hypothetical protein
MSERDPSEEYLWDKSGPPDPLVARLEEKLKRYRYQPLEQRVEDELARAGPHAGIGAGRDCLPPEPEPRSPMRALVFTRAFAIAAGILAMLGVGFLFLSRPSLGSYGVSGIQGLSQVRAGDSFVVGAQPAVVDMGAVGDVTLQPGSRVSVVDCGEKVHQLDLQQGTLSARIFAKPRVFQVGTPAGLTVDLGCLYDLTVDGEGTAQLTVRSGQVSFETQGRKVLVPRGAQCEARKGGVPNTPVMKDADREFVQVLREVELDPSPAREKVDALLFKARGREDSVTLWHLLASPSKDVRERVCDRLEKIYPLPAKGVTRDGLLGGDVAMRDAWRIESIERDWK